MIIKKYSHRIGKKRRQIGWSDFDMGDLVLFHFITVKTGLYQSEASAISSIRSVKTIWENSGGPCAVLRYNVDFGDGFFVENRLSSRCLDRMMASTHERNCTDSVPSQVNRSACQLRVRSSASSTTCSTLQRLSPLRRFFLAASLTHSPSILVAFSSVNGARK